MVCVTCKCKVCGKAGMILKGWFCVCGLFNGEEKTKREECRGCSQPKPMTDLESRNAAIRKEYMRDKTKLTVLGEKYGLSRSRTHQIVKDLPDRRRRGRPTNSGV